MSGGRQGRAALAFVWFVVALDILSLGITLPALPKLVASLGASTGHDGAIIFGWYMSTWHAVHFVAAPVLGELSDRFGRRPILLLSSLGLGLDYVLMALAPTLPLLFVGRIIAGATSATPSVAGAYIADTVPKEQRAASFGALSAAFGVGFVVGPVIGGFLGEVDPRLPFWAAGGLSLLNTAYGFFVFPESLPPEKRRSLSWSSANPMRSFAVLGITRVQLRNSAVLFVNGLSHLVYQSTFALYGALRFGWSSRAIGFGLGVYGFAAVLTQVVATKRLVNRFGEIATLRIGLVSALGALLTVGLTSSPVVCVVAIAFSAFGASIARPSLQSLMTREVSDQHQGQLQGAITSLLSIAGIAGPAIFARSFAWGQASGSSTGPGAPFLLSSVLCLIAVGLVGSPSRR
jgi:DHA1 family tetracycline resistance protein-like MFS transporter